MKKSLLSKSQTSKITEAAGKELRVSNLYKHLSNNLQQLGYFGSADFFKGESKEELKHYQIWADFVNDKGGWLKLPMVPAMDIECSSLKEVFELYYKEEYELGEWYNDWYMECDDATVHQQLLTFIEIQRTSVGEAGDFLATLEACGDDKGAMLLFDQKIK